MCDVLLYNDNVLLERVNNTKYLGLYTDVHLTWEHHVNHCKNRATSNVFAWNSSKHILSQKHLKILYSLVLPYMLYGVILWGNTYQKYLHKLKVVQNNAITAMSGAKYNASSFPHFKVLAILKLKDLCEHQTTLFKHNFVNWQLPSPLLDIYSYHGSTHDHNTR